MWDDQDYQGSVPEHNTSIVFGSLCMYSLRWQEKQNYG